jgi:hypothetical protein
MKELTMSNIRLVFSDFPGNFNPDKILLLLKKKFVIEIDDVNPDYVIYSVFGNDYLNYKNAIRIFFECSKDITILVNGSKVINYGVIKIRLSLDLEQWFPNAYKKGSSNIWCSL